MDFLQEIRENIVYRKLTWSGNPFLRLFSLTSWVCIIITKNSQKIYDVYENLEDYNPTKKRKVLIKFDDMITDMEANKILSTIKPMNWFYEAENSTFHLFLYHNLISKCPKL